MLLSTWSEFTVDFGHVNFDGSGAKTKGRREMRKRKELQSLNVTSLVLQGRVLCDSGGIPFGMPHGENAAAKRHMLSPFIHFPAMQRSIASFNLCQNFIRLHVT